MKRSLLLILTTALVSFRVAAAADTNREIVCTGDPLAQHMTFLHEPFDRRAAPPIEFDGKLQRDFLKTLAPQLGDYEAGSMAEVLAGGANEQFNAHLDALNSGKQNAVFVQGKSGLYVGISPLDGLSDRVLVWMPQKRSIQVVKLFSYGLASSRDDIVIADMAGTVTDRKPNDLPRWTERDEGRFSRITNAIVPLGMHRCHQ